MKGYKFRLEALLKVRRLEEDQCKMEIGRLQVQITNLKDKIKEHNFSITSAYQSQEEALKGGVTGQEIGFYSYMVEGNIASIKLIENNIKKLEENVSELYQELSQYRAKVKVLENMKEKDRLKYKKALNKKEQEKIEEQVQNWKQILG